MSTFIPYLSEKSKQYIKDLANIKKPFTVSNNWYYFQTEDGNFQVAPNQGANGMWGIIYWENGLYGVRYFTASPDPTNERQAIKQLISVYNLQGLLDPAQNDSPKINTSNSVDFSEAYSNWIIEHLIELKWEQNVNGNKRGLNWDFLKPSSTDITNYQNGDFKALKLGDNPNQLKQQITDLTKNQEKHPNYDAVVKEWNDNVGSRIGFDFPSNVDDLKNKWEPWLDNFKALADYWISDFQPDPDFKGKKLDKQSLTLIKQKLIELFKLRKEIKETETYWNEKGLDKRITTKLDKAGIDKIQIELDKYKDYDQIKTDLKSITDKFPDKSIDGILTEIDRLRVREKQLNKIEDYWGNNFPDKNLDFFISTDELKKVKGRLDELDKWQQAFPQGTFPNGLTDVINKVNELKKPTDYDQIKTDLTNANTTIEQLKKDLAKAIQDKIDERKELMKSADEEINRLEKYVKEFLLIKQTELEQKLVKFSLEVYLDKDNIKQQFGDLRQVIKDNVSFDNLKVAEQTLKTIILILAPYHAQEKSLTKHKLLDIQKKYNQLKGDIVKEKNILYTKYQTTIDKYQESKDLIDKLIKA